MSAVSLILIVVASGLALLFWRLLDPPPPLQITDRGILDRRLSLGWLEWHAIEGAYRPRCADGDRLLLRVSVDESLGRRLQRKMPRDQPLPRALELSLDLSGTEYSEVEVLQEIMAHSAAATERSRPMPIGDATRIPCG